MAETKPKTVKGEAREQILIAAKKLIAMHGVDGVSTRAINQAAGVSAGILHYHFGNLEGVVEALLERHMVPLMEARMNAMLALEKQPEVTVRAIMDAVIMPLARKLIDEGDTGVGYVRFLARLYSDHNPTVTKISGKYMGQSPDITFRLLQRALPHIPPQVIRLRTLPFAHGLLNTLADPNLFATASGKTQALSKTEKWKRVETLIEFLCGGFSAPSDIVLE